MQALTMDLLREYVFDDKYEGDHREPVVRFGNIGITGTVSFDKKFMLQFLVMLSFEFLLYILMAILSYYYIVRRRGTIESYLIGYGIVAPVIFYFPFYVIQQFDLRNAAIIINAAAGAAVIIPRLLEAIYGTLPSFAEQSLSKFVLYFAFCLKVRYNSKGDELLPATRDEMIGKSKKIVIEFIAVTLLYSALIPKGYQLFLRRPVQSLADFFWWGNLANSFLTGSLMSLAIDVSTTAASLTMSLLTGVSTADVNSYPLLCSSSPSDFWGNRWNKLVSTGLKQGVYKPLRKYGVSKAVGALVTFVASGLLHEYMLVVLSTRNGVANNPDMVPYEHRYGNQLIFFLYNAFLLLAEYELKNTFIIKWMQKNLPMPARTALILFLVMPVGHLFADEYVNSGILSDVAMFFPRIIFEKEATS